MRNGLLQMIQRFISQRIADPDLSIVNVAARFGLSPRYIQKLFASEKTTFHSYLTNARLDQVQAYFLDGTLADVPYSDIAYRWGFRDMTTFHRNFKARFDETPLQMRRGVPLNANGRPRRQSIRVDDGGARKPAYSRASTENKIGEHDV